MVEKQVKIRTVTDPKALDALLEKLEKTVDIEKETGKVTIKPDADPGEIDALINSIVEVQEVASQPVKMDVDTGGITQGIGDFGSKASSVFDGIGSKCDALGGKFENLSSGLGSLMAGIGLAEMATSAWEGATEKQTNQLLLARKYGTGAAEDISNAISDAVTKTPGDDAFLTSMLSNASLKAKMTKKDLDEMAASIADYQTMSKASGSSTFEAQGEIRNYLMTGETGRMKDTPLAAYMDELEGADTVTERVDALNHALNELGYSGASGMASAENSMETFKGTMQNALTSVGQAFLPAIQGILDKFLELDDALGGNLSKALVVVGGGLAGIVAGAGALGAILPAVGKGFQAIGTGIDILTKGPQIIKGLVSGFQTFEEVITLVREAETLSEGVNAVYAASLDAEAASAAAATGPTTGLAIAENSLLLPLLLVAAAIIALVAILWYLYNNNEQVRAGIDSLIASVQGFLGTLMRLGQAILSAVMPYLQQFFDTVMSIAAAIVTAIIPIIQAWFQRMSLIISIITSVINGNMSLQAALVAIWTIIQQTIVQVVGAIIGFLASFGQQMVSLIFSAFSRVLTTIITQVAMWRAQAIRGVTNMVSGVVSKVRSLPGQIGSAISGVTSKITGPFTSAYNAIKPIIDNIKRAWDMLNSVAGSSGIIPGSAGVVLGSAGIVSGDVSRLGNANSSLMTNTTNSVGGTTNIQLNGIIEESAGDFIVRKLNDELYKQRVVRGI